MAYTNEISVSVFLLILFIGLVKDNHAQMATAVITPSGYNASLKLGANFTFQCDVTGADRVQWLVDNQFAELKKIRDRGIFEEALIVIDRATGSFKRNITISRKVINMNTTIVCRADVSSGNDVDSKAVLFQVQGLLESPPNLTLSEANDRCKRNVLNWDEPFSLDITNVEPDISYYKVCYSLSNSNKSQCKYINQMTEFTFPNVNIPLLFTVSAVNIVGEGNTSSLLHVDVCSNTTGWY